MLVICIQVEHLRKQHRAKLHLVLQHAKRENQGCVGHTADKQQLALSLVRVETVRISDLTTRTHCLSVPHYLIASKWPLHYVAMFSLSLLQVFLHGWLTQCWESNQHLKQTAL